MNSDSKNLVPKVPEYNELPSSRLTQVAGLREATPIEASGTTPVVKAGLPSSAEASGASLDSIKGVFEWDSSTGSLFGPQGPGMGVNQTVKRKKKNNVLRKETSRGDPAVADAGTPVPIKWSHSDGSTRRELKKGKPRGDNRIYSHALADHNKLAIVTAEYPVVRFSEEQIGLV